VGVLSGATCPTVGVPLTAGDVIQGLASEPMSRAPPTFEPVLGKD
jgi:hypothetical protein